MDGGAVGAATALAGTTAVVTVVAEKGDVVGRRGIGVDALEPHVHRPDGDAELVETGEQVEQVMRGQGQLDRLHLMRAEPQRREREGGGQEGRDGRGRAGRGRVRAGLVGAGAGAQLKRVGQGTLVGTDKVGQVLDDHQHRGRRQLVVVVVVVSAMTTGSHVP